MSTDSDTARLAPLTRDWDLVVVGGGITGASIAREASRAGLDTLLLEQGDFASGTSSRSSKLVHGGLRYLKTGEWRLTLHSVREREHLLNEAAGLVEPQGFLMPVWTSSKPGWWIMRIGLWLYDLLARRRVSRSVKRADWQRLAPALGADDLRGVLYFEDARTDDTRLVLRVLSEVSAPSATLNHVRVTGLEREAGVVNGVAWEDRVSGATGTVRARCVVNATGVWAQALGGDAAPTLRPLRGSHLLLNPERLRLPLAVSWMHPRDGRPVFAYEWEGLSLLGTTDLDHADDLNDEPHITAEEVDYLLEAARVVWPSLELGTADVVSTYAGVRPVVASGAANPSEESRESALWQEPGLISVTGGKLTTFRLTAREVLAAVASMLGRRLPAAADRIVDDVAAPAPSGVDPEQWRRLCGRYGAKVEDMAALAQDGDWRCVGSTPYLWLELRWALRREAVEFLDDLLLRRTRIGLVAPHGGAELLDDILALCRSEAGWSEERCTRERLRWQQQWQRAYSLPQETPK